MREAGKFELYKDTKGEFRWRLKSANHEIIATSEGYTTKQSAENSIEAVQEIASKSEIVDMTDKDVVEEK